MSTFRPIQPRTGEARANVRLLLQLEAVGVTEDNLGERSSTSGVVDDLLDDTASVSVALGVIKGSELGGVL